MTEGEGAQRGGCLLNWFANRWILLAMRLILGAVFLYAGIEKMLEPVAFADSIAAFRILPESLVNLVALGLPVFEVLLGGMLMVGYEVRVAALGSLILMGVFILALGSALMRGLKVDCGCFGSGDASSLRMWLGMGRNVLLGMMSWIVMVRDFRDAKP